MTRALRDIAVVDVRDGGPLRHAREGRERARALRNDCLSWGPLALAAPVLPVLDGMAKRWFLHSQSPYVAEVEAISEVLELSGLWFLNGSYQWGCTALAREERGTPWLARTLDWPFRGVGRYVDVAHMSGPAGDFYNITWPGYVGVLTAMAPGRFAAAINQAPLRRRSQISSLRYADVLANSLNTWRHVRHMPPDQLLRQVFENCATFGEAKAQLETVPVARPVIYTLIGCNNGEACVIERTEDGCRTRDHDTVTANDWLVSDPRWEARTMAGFSRSFADAAACSRRRYDSLVNWQGSFAEERFSWLTPPVLNQYTRQAIEMCPAAGVLRLVGYERARAKAPAEPVTAVCELTAEQAVA